MSYPLNQEQAIELYNSDLPTDVLVGLALSVRVAENTGRNELHGRSHAYFYIASSPVAAIEHMVVMAEEGKDRKVACDALAAAGYDASFIIAQARAEALA